MRALSPGSGPEAREVGRHAGARIADRRDAPACRASGSANTHWRAESSNRMLERVCADATVRSQRPGWGHFRRPRAWHPIAAAPRRTDRHRIQRREWHPIPLAD